MHSVRKVFFTRTCCLLQRSSIQIRSSSSAQDKLRIINDDVDSLKKDELIHEEKSLEPTKKPPSEVDFWKTERGLVLREQMMTGLGRTLRLFISKERYDNMYESAAMTEYKLAEKFNTGNDLVLQLHGPEWNLGLIIFNLGGAVKLVYDDRWIEDVRNIRTAKKKDFRLEAIDLRKSAINYKGLKYLNGAQYVRYFNAGDAKCFDDCALSCLHPLSDTLEFLDISGTSVTERGFAYMRLFSKLKYLNISRLEKAKDLDQLIPFLQEILPEDCVIVKNDDVPAENYGYPITFRHPKNPWKDVIEGDKDIGDLTVFKENHGSEIELHQPDVMHRLWMTPTIGRVRHRRLRLQQNLDKNFMFTLVKYIVKAENYKPLL